MLKNCLINLYLLFCFSFLLAGSGIASSESVTDALASDELLEENLLNDEHYVKNIAYLNNLQKNILVLEDHKSSLIPNPFFTWMPHIATQQYLSNHLRYKIKQTQPVYTLISRPLDNAIGSESLSTVYQSLQQYNPEVVVIKTGFDDGLRSFPVEQIENYLSAMIMQAKKHNAKVILMGSNLPFFYNFEYSRQFGSMYQKLALEHSICYIALPSVSPFAFFPGEQITTIT